MIGLFFSLTHHSTHAFWFGASGTSPQ
jgi:hypothetical protein